MRKATFFFYFAVLNTLLFLAADPAVATVCTATTAGIWKSSTTRRGSESPLPRNHCWH